MLRSLVESNQSVLKLDESDIYEDDVMVKALDLYKQKVGKPFVGICFFQRVM